MREEEKQLFSKWFRLIYRFIDSKKQQKPNVCLSPGTKLDWTRKKATGKINEEERKICGKKSCLGMQKRLKMCKYAHTTRITKANQWASFFPLSVSLLLHFFVVVTPLYSIEIHSMSSNVFFVALLLLYMDVSICEYRSVIPYNSYLFLSLHIHIGVWRIRTLIQFLSVARRLSCWLEAAGDSRRAIHTYLYTCYRYLCTRAIVVDCFATISLTCFASLFVVAFFVCCRRRRRRRRR